MWKEFITEAIEHAQFCPPMSAHRRSEVEATLGVQFPDDLRGLLRETNGVLGEYELGLIWDVDRIETDNLQFRNNADFDELYMPFDHLLFFADNGCGDQFAYPIHAGTIRRPDIFVWDHESDSRSWVAPTLREYFEWGESGKLT